MFPHWPSISASILAHINDRPGPSSSVQSCPVLVSVSVSAAAKSNSTSIVANTFSLSKESRERKMMGGKGFSGMWLLLLSVSVGIVCSSGSRNNIFSHDDLVQVTPVVINPGQSYRSNQPYVAFVPVGRAGRFNGNQNIQQFAAPVRQPQQQQFQPQQQQFVPQQQQPQQQQQQRPASSKSLNFNAASGDQKLMFGTQEETFGPPQQQQQQQPQQQQQQRQYIPRTRKRVRFAASGR